MKQTIKLVTVLLLLSCSNSTSNNIDDYPNLIIGTWVRSDNFEKFKFYENKKYSYVNMNGSTDSSYYDIIKDGIAFPDKTIQIKLTANKLIFLRQTSGMVHVPENEFNQLTFLRD